MKHQILQLLFLAVVFFTFSNCSTSDATEKESETTFSANMETKEISKRLSIAPPIANMEVAAQTFTVDASKAKVLAMDNGSSIEIPANAFVDENGNIVEGEVQIEYRAFQSPAQIIASGIPMKVVSETGEEEWMQTAGMFEIEGFVNNQAIFIADGKSINVNMASAVDGDYDFWYFDEEVGNWSDIGDSQPTVNEKASSSSRTLTTAFVKTTELPKKPVAYNEKHALNFELDYSDFPSLKDKKNIVWQYASKDEKQSPTQNQWIYSEEWNDIQLESSDEEIYELTLTSDTKTYSIPVVAVLRGKDYEAAMTEYKKELKIYESALIMLDQKDAIAAKNANFLRSQRVENFGIYNYDILYKDRTRLQLAADFEFDDIYNSVGMKELITVYLITADQKAIVPFNHQNRERFSMNPDADNKLLAILPNDQFAVFDQADFDAQKEQILNARGGTYTFRMKIVEQPVASVEDLDQVIL